MGRNRKRFKSKFGWGKINRDPAGLSFQSKYKTWNGIKSKVSKLLVKKMKIVTVTNLLSMLDP